MDLNLLMGLICGSCPTLLSWDLRATLTLLLLNCWTINTARKAYTNFYWGTGFFFQFQPTFPYGDGKWARSNRQPKPTRQSHMHIRKKWFIQFYLECRWKNAKYFTSPVFGLAFSFGSRSDEKPTISLGKVIDKIFFLFLWMCDCWITKQTK